MNDSNPRPKRISFNECEKNIWDTNIGGERSRDVKSTFFHANDPLLDWQDVRIDELERENIAIKNILEVKDARIEELEKEIEYKEMTVSSEKRELNILRAKFDTMKELGIFGKHNKRIAALREALSFYADKENWGFYGRKKTMQSYRDIKPQDQEKIGEAKEGIWVGGKIARTAIQKDDEYDVCNS